MRRMLVEVVKRILGGEQRGAGARVLHGMHDALFDSTRQGACRMSGNNQAFPRHSNHKHAHEWLPAASPATATLQPDCPRTPPPTTPARRTQALSR